MNAFDKPSFGAQPRESHVDTFTSAGDISTSAMRGCIYGLICGVFIGGAGGAQLVKAEVDAIESISGTRTSDKFHALMDEVVAQESSEPLSGSAIGVRAIVAANHIGAGAALGIFGGLMFGAVRNRRRY